MGMLNAIGRRGMSSLRSGEMFGAPQRASQSAESMALLRSQGADMLQHLRPESAALSQPGVAFLQRLKARAMQLQHDPSPRARNELNETFDLIRRIEAGETTLS